MPTMPRHGIFVALTPFRGRIRSVREATGGIAQLAPSWMQGRGDRPHWAPCTARVVQYCMHIYYAALRIGDLCILFLPLPYQVRDYRALNHAVGVEEYSI